MDKSRIKGNVAKSGVVRKSARHVRAAKERWKKYRAGIPTAEKVPEVLGEIILRGWVFGQEIRLMLKAGDRRDNFVVLQNGQEINATSATDIGRTIAKLIPPPGFWKG